MERGSDEELRGAFDSLWQRQAEYEAEILNHALGELDIKPVNMPKQTILSTDNPDPNSWIKSFMKDDKKKVDYAEELKKLSEQPIEGLEELKSMLYDDMDECIKKTAEYEKDAKFFMMLQVSIAENMPLRKAYENFDLKRVEIEPLAERYDRQNIMSYASCEYRYKLVKLDEPRRIPNDVWHDYFTELYDRLIKKLGLDIG